MVNFYRPFIPHATETHMDKAHFVEKIQPLKVIAAKFDETQLDDHRSTYRA